MIKTKYIILCWIILLIIFTLFCIYKLFMNTKQYKYISNNFYDIPNDLPIINYIDNIKKNDKIINLNECENIYDDNYSVRNLGYNNCKTANAYYFSNNMNTTNKYGHKKSLSEICPASTNSDKYSNCMRQLLNKFNTNADIVNTINKDMTSIINERINKRSELLDNIEYNLNDSIPYSVHSTLNNIDVNTNNNTNYDKISQSASTYYQLKNNIGKSIFDNIDNIDNNDIQPLEEKPASTSITSITSIKEKEINSYINNNISNFNEDIAKKFYGYYTPIQGQFLAFNNLTIILNYKLIDEYTYKFQTNIITNNTSNINKSKYNLVLNIKDNATSNQLLYNITNIDYYLQYKNIIQIDIKEFFTISVNSNKLNILKKLLETLGLKSPCKLLLAIIDSTSTENIKHRTFKLLNIDMHSIMQLNKI